MICSVSPSCETKEEALVKGVNVFLLKPYEPDVLVETGQIWLSSAN